MLLLNKLSVKHNLQPENYGYAAFRSRLAMSQHICYALMTENKGLVTVYRHSESLLKNNFEYSVMCRTWSHNCKAMLFR